MESAKNLRIWISDGLRARGLSQTDLARHLGLDASAVNRMVLGSRQIKAPELMQIQQLFEATPPADKPVRGRPIAGTMNLGVAIQPNGTVALELKRVVPLATAMAILKLLEDEGGPAA